MFWDFLIIATYWRFQVSWWTKIPFSGFSEPDRTLLLVYFLSTRYILMLLRIHGFSWLLQELSLDVSTVFLKVSSWSIQKSMHSQDFLFPQKIILGMVHKSPQDILSNHRTILGMVHKSSQYILSHHRTLRISWVSTEAALACFTEHSGFPGHTRERPGHVMLRSINP